MAVDADLGVGRPSAQDCCCRGKKWHEMSHVRLLCETGFVAAIRRPARSEFPAVPKSEAVILNA